MDAFAGDIAFFALTGDVLLVVSLGDDWGLALLKLLTGDFLLARAGVDLGFAGGEFLLVVADGDFLATNDFAGDGLGFAGDLIDALA